MEELTSVHTWDPPAVEQFSWEEMADGFLQEPDALPGGAAFEADAEWEEEDGDLLDLLMTNIVETGSGENSDSAEWWTNSLPVEDSVFNNSQLPDLPNSFTNQASLPALSSEASSFDILGLDSLPMSLTSLPALLSEVSSFHSVPVDSAKMSLETVDDSFDQGVSSLESCNRVKTDAIPASNSDDEAGIVSSHSHSPNPTSYSELKADSPDTVSYSSDVGAIGKSCDDFSVESQKRVSSAAGAIDEDAKRQSRLMRNRESATQSRLRKKSYVKELEAKCRMMECQMNMLHQTVTFTSAQNAALREELALVKSLKVNGSKSGVMEPAALPSDSLPSESPSRRSFPCLLVKWDLVAYLCHVLLLTLVQAPHLKLAPSEERPPSEVRSERHDTTDFSGAKQQLGNLVGQAWNREHASCGRKCNCTSHRRKKRFVTLKSTWLASHGCLAVIHHESGNRSSSVKTRKSGRISRNSFRTPRRRLIGRRVRIDSSCS